MSNDTMNTDDIQKCWLAKLTRLNPASGRGECRGKAPHKPLLLLALLDLAESGELPSRAFTRSPGLALRFRSYGSIVADRWPTRLDLRMPFFHLSTQGFWEPLTNEMHRAGSPESCAVCEMDPEFFALLADATFRLKARMILVSRYFTPEEKIALFETLGLQTGGRDETTTARVLEEAEEVAKRKGRCARFAVRVVSEYRFTCALTGYRCLTSDSATIVDAAHIEAWATTQNDNPENGLALSKNAHWMFDEGLWSVDEDFRIVVASNRFTENGPEALKLVSFAGRHLQFDPSAKLRPAPELLKRHRHYHGIRSRS
ncbi:MAG: HNH endonuclease [Chthoniobacteraceae bacterium]